VDEFPRHAFFIQDALDHGPVAAERCNRQPVSCGRVRRSSYVSRTASFTPGATANVAPPAPHLSFSLGSTGKSFAGCLPRGFSNWPSSMPAGRPGRQIQAWMASTFIQLALVFLAVGGILVDASSIESMAGRFPGVPDIVALVIRLRLKLRSARRTSESREPSARRTADWSAEGGTSFNTDWVGRREVRQARFPDASVEAGGRNAIRNLDGWLNPHPVVVRATAPRKEEERLRSTSLLPRTTEISYFAKPVPVRT